MEHGNNFDLTISGNGPGAGEALLQENLELRQRQTMFTEASLYMTQSLDLKTVMESCLAGARWLSEANFGAVAAKNAADEKVTAYTSGLTEETEAKWKKVSMVTELFAHLNSLTTCLRLPNLAVYASAQGFPGEHYPAVPFLSAPLQLGGGHIGNIHLANGEGGREFTTTDEETLITFAAQAATAISNSQRYGEQQRARADLEALVNISPVGIAVLDANTGELLALNHETRRFFGTIIQEGRTLTEDLPELTIRRASRGEIVLEPTSMRQLLKSGEVILAEEMTLTAAGFGSISILVNAAPIFDDLGEVTSVVFTLQDLTPNYELDRLRAELLSTVGNNLRAPLSTIKRSVATLLNTPSALNSPESEQLLLIIDQQGDLMRTQINRLIEITRVESGLPAISPSNVDVLTLVNEAVALHEQGKTRVAVETVISPMLPQAVADKERISQALQNLLALAERHATTTTEVRITAAQDDLFIAITVSVSALGVPGHRLSSLFTRLSPFPPEIDQRSTGGEGLDIAICKGIVEAHGGRLWAGIGPGGRGINFTFTLPAAAESRPDAPADPVQQEARMGLQARERSRVLVVVDDSSTLRSVRNSLAGSGYAVIASYSLEDLDLRIQTEKPQALLLDLTMAGKRGYDLLRRVTTEYGVPAIVLSGQGSDDHIVRAFEMGAADYIVKPFSPPELVARIKASVRKRTAPHEAHLFETYQIDGLRVEFSARSVTVDGRVLQLTPTEYKLLCELAGSAGRVLTQDELLRRVWGTEYAGEPQLLRAYVKTLRQKLGDDARNPKYIFTEHGVGYRMPRR